MASPADRRTLIASLLAAAGGATCLYLGTGLHPVWPLAWLAPLPVVLFALRHRARSAALVAFAAWALGGLNLWSYLRQALEVPLAPVLLFLLVPAAVFAAAVLLTRALARRGHLLTGALALPAAWVSFELALAGTSPNGTAGNLAYSQSGFLPLVQLATVTGVWGISFLVLLLPTALALALDRPGERRRWVVATAAAGAVVVTLSVGTARLAARADMAPSLIVGLAATDAPAHLFPTTAAEATATLAAYSEQLRFLAAEGARVVVLPEKLAPVATAELEAATEALRAQARRSGVVLVAGLTLTGGAAKRNVAVVVTPDGTIDGTYDKHHLVPGYEAQFRPGSDLLFLSPASSPARAGIAICKDLDFPPLARRYGRAATALLLAPAWDFGRDGWLHSRMAVWRGVESGFTVVRAAKQGRLTVSDAHGRVLAEAASSADGFVRLSAAAPIRHVPTLYARWGDWFGWLAVAVFVACIARLLASLAAQRRVLLLP